MWKVISLRKAPWKRLGALAVFLVMVSFATNMAWDRLLDNTMDSPEAVTVLAQFNPLAQTAAVQTIDLNEEAQLQGTEEDAPAALELKVEVVTPAPESAENPQKVLIYHTHTYEAYRQDDAAPYKETEKWRTKDEAHNMVRVGAELTQLLTAKGYQVVHDTQAFEPPELSSAYTRSLAMLEERASKGETYDLYIDLHRDAYTQSMAKQNTVKVGDQHVARLMVLIGKGSGQSYVEKPDWEKNYDAAQMLTADLNDQVQGLCRSISLKSGRFNQHVGDCCLLVEAGNNENTLEEVLAAMPYLADGIHHLLSAMK